MTLKRVKDWTPPKHPKSVEDIDKYLNQHYRDHVDESFARIQDFYEQSKIGDASDVSVSGEDAGELLIYNATDSQWENAALTEGTGISITEADASITVGVDSDDVFLLDQTTPQTVSNGIPLLDQAYDDFSELTEFVNKGYVDWAVTAIGVIYYMTDDTDGDTGYKVCSLTPSAGGETYAEISSITDDQLLGTWISDVGEAPSKLLRGIYDWLIFAEKTAGTETLRLYWKLYERKDDDSEVLVATSSESNELDLDTKTSYIVPLVLHSDYDPDDGSRIVGKIYAAVSGSGNAPTVKIYYQGSSGGRWEIPANTEVLDNIYVKQTDHTKAAHDALNIDADTLDSHDSTYFAVHGGAEHDGFSDFVANEHIDHTGVTLTAGTGLTGGGDISANRTFDVDVGIADNKIVQVDGTPTDNEYAKWTASGLEGRSYVQVLSDLSGQAGAAFSWNNKNLTNVGDITAAGLAVDTDTLYVDKTNDRVGIGTISPNAKLMVTENGENVTQTVFTQAVSNAGLLINTEYASGAFTPGLFWNTSNNQPTKPKAGIYLKETGEGTYMYFGTSYAYSAGITNNAIVIDYNGNIGIGITSPDTILDINGAFTFRELSADPSDPDEGSAVLWMSDGTGSGDDGDIMLKITAGGSTKTTTLVDFSTI